MNTISAHDDDGQVHSPRPLRPGMLASMTAWFGRRLAPKNATPYHFGFDAYYAGTDNPYPAGSAEHGDWEHGYASGKAAADW